MERENMGELTPPEVGQQAALDAALGSSAKTDPLPSLPSHGRNSGLKTTLLTTVTGLAVAGCGIFGLNVAGVGKSGESQAPATPPPSVEVSDSPIPTPINSENPTIVIPSSSPTEASEQSLAPSAYVEKSPGNFTWTTEAGEIKDVPVIRGLTAKLSADETRIAYFTNAGNEYSIAANAEAGNFKQDVFMKENGADVQIGGAALDGKVVAKLMQHKLDSISDPNKKITIPSPVAPNGRLDVSFYQQDFPISGETGFPAVSFRYKGATSVGNIVPNNKGIMCENTISSPSWGCWDIHNFVDGAPKMNTLTLFGPNTATKTAFDTTTKSSYAIGGKLVTDAPDEVDIIDSGTAPGQAKTPLTQDNLLSMNGSLVLLKVAA